MFHLSLYLFVPLIIFVYFFIYFVWVLKLAENICGDWIMEKKSSRVEILREKIKTTFIVFFFEIVRPTISTVQFF
jgi:hypothetical protein